MPAACIYCSKCFKKAHNLSISTVRTSSESRIIKYRLMRFSKCNAVLHMTFTNYVCIYAACMLMIDYLPRLRVTYCTIFDAPLKYCIAYQKLLFSVYQISIFTILLFGLLCLLHLERLWPIMTQNTAIHRCQGYTIRPLIKLPFQSDVAE